MIELLVYLAAAAAAGVVGGASDRAAQASLRAIRDRISHLRTNPESSDLVRGLRIAHMRALERVIRGFQEVGQPSSSKETPNRPVDFLRLGLAYCQRTAGRRQSDVSFSELPFESRDALSSLLFNSLHGESTASTQKLVRFVEDAVLRDLVDELNVDLPVGFEEHFRNGSGSTPRFVDAFVEFVEQQLSQDDSFARALQSSLLLHIDRNVEWTQRAILDVREEVIRVGDGVVDVRSMLERARAEDVPVSVIQGSLESVGERGIPADKAVERLNTVLADYKLLRDQARASAEQSPALADVGEDVMAMIALNDRAGAIARISDARNSLRERAAHEDAVLAAQVGFIERMNLNYKQSGMHFREAADLVAFDVIGRWRWLFEEANSLRLDGEVFGGDSELERAVEVYEEAIAPLPQSAYRTEYAKTQRSRGETLRIRGERRSSSNREGSMLLEKAVESFRIAQRVCPRDLDSREWAASQRALGVALARLGERSGSAADVREAVQAFRRAQEVSASDRDAENGEWQTLLQSDLGNAYRMLGILTDDSDILHKAVAAHQASLEVFSASGSTADIGRTLNSIGNVRMALGKRAGSGERVGHFSSAEEAFRSALTLAAPGGHSRAITLNNLGTALLNLGIIQDQPEQLQEALDLFHEAISLLSRDQVPLEWARTRKHMSMAHRFLGEHLGSEYHLRRAVSAAMEALQSLSPDVFLELALCELVLGDSLFALGLYTSTAQNVEDAGDSYRSAHDKFCRIGADHFVSVTAAKMQLAENSLGELLQVNDGPVRKPGG